MSVIDMIEPSAATTLADAPVPAASLPTSPFGQELTLAALPDDERPGPLRVAQAAPTGGDPNRLLHMAIERGLPMETIDKLMTMVERFEQFQERDRARRAEAEYIRALADLKAEVVTVLKTKQVGFTSKRTQGTTSYMHAELSDVMEAVAPVAARVGLTWNYPEVEQGADWVRVTCRLRHVGGHYEDLTLGGPLDTSGNKNPLQSIKSSLTYLERTTLELMLGISEKGQDDDGRGGKLPDEYRRDLGDDTPQPVEGNAHRGRLIVAGNEKALGGLKELTAWWAALPREDRDLVGADFRGIKERAQKADAGGAQ
jgi:hypothetical protein